MNVLKNQLKKSHIKVDKNQVLHTNFNKHTKSQNSKKQKQQHDLSRAQSLEDNDDSMLFMLNITAKTKGRRFKEQKQMV